MPISANRIAVLLFLTGVILAGCGPAQEQPAQQTEAPAAATPKAAAPGAMELLETKISATQEALTIVGQVKNTYARDVRGVTVYCDFQDSSSQTIQVEEGTLKTDPLPPNTVSEFRFSIKYNPEIKRFNVTFAELFGGKLITKDSRK